MKHDKYLEPEETHVVVTVEDDDHEPEEKFRGTKRECEAFIKQTGLITLTIEEICQ
jgi:hypothetical protein